MVAVSEQRTEVSKCERAYVRSKGEEDYQRGDRVWVAERRDRQFI